MYYTDLHTWSGLLLWDSQSVQKVLLFLSFSCWQHCQALILLQKSKWIIRNRSQKVNMNQNECHFTWCTECEPADQTQVLHRQIRFLTCGIKPGPHCSLFCPRNDYLIRKRLFDWHLTRSTTVHSYVFCLEAV